VKHPVGTEACSFVSLRQVVCGGSWEGGTGGQVRATRPAIILR